MSAKQTHMDDLWAHHHGEYRDPHQIVTGWKQASEIDPALFEQRVQGQWWDILDACQKTILVTREYEHLVMAYCVHNGRKRVSYLHLPHPNGIAVDAARQRIYIASTRNPNLIIDLAPSARFLADKIQTSNAELCGLLLPTRARYLPGSLYIHDLALIGHDLYANAVGLNAVVRLTPEGKFEPVWWPRCIDSKHGPLFDKNYLQLNSIAPGKAITSSFFTASTATPSTRRPGHLHFPVDRRGVVFSGKTREVVGTGLTRPHSARLYRGEVWVDNSGYGELGRLKNGRFEAIHKLNGWTRGLCFCGDIAFVGTSRVIPKYSHYAPGIRAADSVCGVHALHIPSGKLLGSVIWPAGNQIFAIALIDRRITQGFPFLIRRNRSQQLHSCLFARGLTA